MNRMIAFIKKEWLELVRGHKLIIATAIFMLFGMMNPAIAKLTPTLFEMLSEDLSEQGMIITSVDISAVQCWQQYNKNISMILILFVIMFAGILANEYQKGTLLLVVTKGLSQKCIYFSKTIILCSVWTIGFLLMTVITWFYAEFYWDNTIMHNMPEAIFSIWLFGMMLCSLIMLFSSICNGMTGVLIGVGSIVFVSVILGIIPKLLKYLPTSLISMDGVMNGKAEIEITAIIICALISVVSMSAGAVIFGKRAL